ncbi:MAG: LysR family transcriptional regulator [Deltaproteobacteria bacterium]|nr:LysR family transcriptional regulator [Deltaproteobacteria bacterium]MBW1923603.1 LysR family transcriptional regulator [Deltaproteobacteria bacterium]MBW1948694.1 LysR family transcriptional regulator [Deltaproteobacteria bacterium]MBW2006863.1 LysR family transcriptional regulator [Deltaproteobacteria bacterium]MBW2101118.1 LysR family transcriptional regulator [Deltaproteobacteria bacterium]
MGRLRLRSRQWIVDEDDHIIMGDGRREILEHIEQTGSINQAAKRMRMSYKGVWAKIKATEKYLEKRIVDTDKRTGTRLTDEGRALLRKYREFKAVCVREEEKAFRRIFEGQ